MKPGFFNCFYYSEASITILLSKRFSGSSLRLIESRLWITDSYKFTRSSNILYLSIQLVSHIGFIFDFNTSLPGFFNETDNYTSFFDVLEKIYETVQPSRQLHVQS